MVITNNAKNNFFGEEVNFMAKKKAHKKVKKTKKVVRKTHKKVKKAKKAKKRR